MSKDSLRATYLLVEEAVQDGNNEALRGQRERTASGYLFLASRQPQSFFCLFPHNPQAVVQVFGKREGRCLRY